MCHITGLIVYYLRMVHAVGAVVVITTIIVIVIIIGGRKLLRQ